jgi:hypothetical protein
MCKISGDQIIALLNSLSPESRIKALEFISLLKYTETELGQRDEIAHKA